MVLHYKTDKYSETINIMSSGHVVQVRHTSYFVNLNYLKQYIVLGIYMHFIRLYNFCFQSSGNRVGSCGLGVCGSEQEPVVGSCVHSNEPSGSIRGVEFIDYLSDY
jgi:hypothetical protein